MIRIISARLLITDLIFLHFRLFLADRKKRDPRTNGRTNGRTHGHTLLYSHESRLKSRVHGCLSQVGRGGKKSLLASTGFRTLWPSYRPTDWPTNQQTNQQTNWSTEWLTQSRAHDYKWLRGLFFGWNTWYYSISSNNCKIGQKTSEFCPQFRRAAMELFFLRVNNQWSNWNFLQNYYQTITPTIPWFV